MCRKFNVQRVAPLLIALFFSAVSISQETARDSVKLIQDYQQKAAEAIKTQSFQEAIANLTAANRMVGNMKNDSLQLSIKFEVAELHYTLHNYDKAKSELENVIENLRSERNRIKLAEAQALYGMILTQLGEYEKAGINLNEASSVLSSYNEEQKQAKALYGLAVLQIKQKKYTDAVNYLDAAMVSFEKYGEQELMAEAYLKKAEAVLNLGEEAGFNIIDEANKSLESANVIIKDYGYMALDIESLKVASYIALRQNEYQKAEEFLGMYERKNDSLHNEYLAAIFKGLEIDSNIQILQQRIEEQQDNIDKQQKSINFGKMTTGLSIALIIILSLLTLSLYKNNNLRAKANELLQDKNNELQLAKEKAEKASLAKAQFLSTITHELRTPLYAVTGLTHLLLEEDPKPHQKEHLNSLKFSGEYLLSLINNILDLNKLEANKVEIEKTSFSLKKRINDVLIALKKSADDRKNRLHLEYDESIPTRLVGDPLKLSQVLINLIGNSVKFTQNGDVWVRVNMLETKNNRVNLHFEIEDNGVGISKKKQKSIFETFSQASLQINRKFGGTGLGLSIVKNLLELMGSKINLESQLGKGSKFWFNINLDISEEIQEEKNTKNIIYDVDYVALENRKVLVVEDNKINQMITRKILEKNKMNCMVADNGVDAIKMVKGNEFDVILMDIHMPGISGVEATQKIRTFNKEIPIIALTAVTIDENLDDFYKAGFNEIIPKPFKTEEFFEKIYRTIEGGATVS